MTLFLHEIKQNRLSFLIWTFSIALMLLICMMMFPEMNTGMEDMNNMFSNMGSFTQAFGMDRLNFGDVMGFYAIECGNILSIGGGFFAALLGINVLAKEEKERTAEFLLTHPVRRRTVIFQKLAAILFELLLMNVFIMAVSAASFAFIDEELAIREFLLLHGSYDLWCLHRSPTGDCLHLFRDFRLYPPQRCWCRPRPCRPALLFKPI